MTHRRLVKIKFLFRSVTNKIKNKNFPKRLDLSKYDSNQTNGPLFALRVKNFEIIESMIRCESNHLQLAFPIDHSLHQKTSASYKRAYRYDLNRSVYPCIYHYQVKVELYWETWNRIYGRQPLTPKCFYRCGALFRISCWVYVWFSSSEILSSKNRWH